MTLIVRDEDRDPRNVTFVNPQPESTPGLRADRAGAGPEAAGDPAAGRRGPGDGRGLARVPVDLSGLTNLHRMANTPDPRDFYRVSRVVLVPSLWRESLGRVAVEAMANGIPVLASDRGALPETLGDAGFVLTIPERYTATSLAVPTPRRWRRGWRSSSGCGTTPRSRRGIRPWPGPRRGDGTLIRSLTSTRASFAPCVRGPDTY